MGDDPITVWIHRIADGDEVAAEGIWNSYFSKMANWAERKLKSWQRRVSDEEDIALEAMHSLIRGIQAQRFPKLDDREDLWKLAMVLTARKATQHRRRESAQKRGGGHVGGESMLAPSEQDYTAGIEQVMGQEPTPEFVVETGETCDQLLGLLGDETLREIALAKLAGYENEEIAEQKQCSERTIARRLKSIRQIWQEASLDSNDADSLP